MTVTTLVHADGTSEIEKSILGGVLQQHEKLAECVEAGLKIQHFHFSVHQKIFNAMLMLETQNKTCDLVTVGQLLQKDKEFNLAYLAELIGDAPVSENLNHYVELLGAKYKHRMVDRTLRNALEHLKTDGSADDVMEGVEAAFLTLSESEDEQGIVPIDVVIQETMQEIEETINNKGAFRGCSTGFSNLDDFTHGLNNSDLIILAGRPGMGKTAFALNLASNVIEAGKKVLFFSLEMGSTQLAGRLVANKARVDGNKLRTGIFTGDELDRVTKSGAELYLHSNNFGIDSTSAIPLAKLRMRATRWKKRHGCDLLIVDYLQLMTPSATSKKQSREREIGELSNGLKALAKDLNIPIIVLSQLNRETAKSTDKEPQLHNLRDSGSIEQDADQILFVHRPGYYDNTDKSITQIKIAKNRHGEVGYCNFNFNLGQMRFEPKEE